MIELKTRDPSEIPDSVFIEKMTTIMQDANSLLIFAEACNRQYFYSLPGNKGLTYEPMYTNDDRDALINSESILDFDRARVKLAQNTVGIAALQEGLDGSVEFGMSQSQMLSLVANDVFVPNNIKMSLCKYAHAVWYQTAIARGRQNRSVVMQFSQLPEDEKVKDWTQIVTSAKVLFEMISTGK